MMLLCWFLNVKLKFRWGIMDNLKIVGTDATKLQLLHISGAINSYTFSEFETKIFDANGSIYIPIIQQFYKASIKIYFSAT